ncbi:Casparian strip membrane protein 1 [Bienertia sinuspersici]
MAPHDNEPTCSFVGKSPFFDDGEIGFDHHNCSHCRSSDSLSSSSSYSYSISETDSDVIKRIVHASAKGFSIGAGLKGGLSIFSLLARLSRRRSTKSLKKVSPVSSSEEILSEITETLR